MRMKMTGFKLEDERAMAQLPPSNDELVIAYSMVAALFQLVQRWARGDQFDDRAKSVMESAERLLLRSDVMQRILRMAGMERRNEFMVDHIELLEQQKQQLLRALRPFAQLVDTTKEDTGSPFVPSAVDLTRARMVYNMLVEMNEKPTAKPIHPHANVH